MSTIEWCVEEESEREFSLNWLEAFTEWRRFVHLYQTPILVFEEKCTCASQFGDWKIANLMDIFYRKYMLPIEAWFISP